MLILMSMGVTSLRISPSWEMFRERLFLKYGILFKPNQSETHLILLAIKLKTPKEII